MSLRHYSHSFISRAQVPLQSNLDHVREKIWHQRHRAHFCILLSGLHKSAAMTFLSLLWRVYNSGIAPLCILLWCIRIALRLFFYCASAIRRSSYRYCRIAIWSLEFEFCITKVFGCTEYRMPKAIWNTFILSVRFLISCWIYLGVAKQI